MSLIPPYSILLDPGHGGADYGAVNEVTGLREAHVVFDVSNILLGLIAADPHHRMVAQLSRTKGEFISLTGRAEMANRLNADLLLSIHCNSATNKEAHGYEVFTSPGQTESDVVATHLYESWEHDFPDRAGRKDTTDNDPDKEASFTVLTKSAKSAVLFELEFIHNVQGHAFLSDQRNQELMAHSLFRGLNSYLDARFGPTILPPPDRPDGDFLASRKRLIAETRQLIGRIEQLDKEMGCG